ncbi:hypothetical protein ALQ54_200072 [Pseudomonas syringae]|nr:hypothetical protein ALQ54_200072 [Pseudomonas syringae]
MLRRAYLVKRYVLRPKMLKKIEFCEENQR